MEPTMPTTQSPTAVRPSAQPVAGVIIKPGQSLQELNTWGVGGAAEFYAQPRSIKEVQVLFAWAMERSLEVKVLGEGSNILIHDSGVKGLVMHLNLLKGIKETPSRERFVVEALAGTPKFVLARAFLTHGLKPAVFLTGIPGSVGGGVVMNAGLGSKELSPREFCDITDWVECVVPDFHKKSLRLVRLDKSLKWSYRKGAGWPRGSIVVRAGFSWPYAKDQSQKSASRSRLMQSIMPNIMKELKAFNKKRNASQPLNLPSGGSTFKNPLPLRAGALIESCGLKGFTKGVARVSEKHANFIVVPRQNASMQKGTAADVAFLIQHIQKTVKQKHGIELEPECVLWGF